MAKGDTLRKQYISLLFAVLPKCDSPFFAIFVSSDILSVGADLKGGLENDLLWDPADKLLGEVYDPLDLGLQGLGGRPDDLVHFLLHLCAELLLTKHVL